MYSCSLIALAGITFFEKTQQHNVFLGLIAFAIVASTIGIIIRMILDEKIEDRLERLETKTISHKMKILYLEEKTKNNTKTLTPT